MIERLKIAPGLSGSVWRYLDPTRRNFMHRHAELEFNLIREGRARYLLSGRRYDLARHHLVWLFPGQEHLLVEPSPDFRMWIAVFRPALVRTATTDRSAKLLRSRDPGRAVLAQLSAHQAARLDVLMTEIETGQDDPGLYNAGLIYLLRATWAVFLDPQSTPEGAALHPSVQMAARLLRERPDELDLDGLSAEVHLSASHLSRLFKEQVGLSLSEYRNRQRIARFLSFHASGYRTNMLEAALKAGFGSYAQFHRIFRRVVGMSPQAYRRSQAGDNLRGSEG